MTPQLALRAAALGGMLAASAVSSANAAPMPSACSMLPLANVQSIVGAPVTIFHDQAPVMARDGLEATNCTYMVSLRGGLSASVWLGRGSPARIAAMHQKYGTMAKRPGADGVRGNTIAVVNVANAARAGVVYRPDLSKKLLDAVLSKV